MIDNTRDLSTIQIPLSRAAANPRKFPDLPNLLSNILEFPFDGQSAIGRTQKATATSKRFLRFMPSPEIRARRPFAFPRNGVAQFARDDNVVF